MSTIKVDELVVAQWLHSRDWWLVAPGRWQHDDLAESHGPATTAEALEIDLFRDYEQAVDDDLSEVTSVDDPALYESPFEEEG